MKNTPTPDQSSPFSHEVISVRIHDAVRMTGLSRSKIYQLIASGDLEIAKVGRSTVVLVTSLRSFIASRRKRIR